MIPKNNNSLYSFRYQIERKDIEDFVNQLHNIQAEYMEAAVEASGLKEAKAVIKHVMELK